MSDTLARILDDKRQHIAACKARRSLADVQAAARQADPVRGFRLALREARNAGRFGLIAEIKKASPSKGLIRADFDPATLAKAYAAGGATCLSVLTDVPWFQGADAYLGEARAAAQLPVLRKDFMIDVYQVYEARALGADCILLIMAAIDLPLARELEQIAHGLGMDVLIEVHNATELSQARQMDSRLIGVNNRNLSTLKVDINLSVELSKGLTDEYLIVGESGLKSRADLDLLAGHGIGCFLVGESLMLQTDVEAATRRLLEG
jgi:indole-3-glycerol phosphate synthase